MLKIAHRGASGYVSENTLEAFERAIRLKANAIEFDVRCTKDGEIVVIHDHFLKRTINHSGLVCKLTLKELRTCYELNGGSIPTLQEALDALKHRCICKVDIKDRGVTEKVIRIIKRNGMLRSVIITSRIPSVLVRVRRLTPSIKLAVGGLQGSVSVTTILNRARLAKADIVDLHYSIATKETVEQVRRNAFKVHVWTTDDKRIIKKLKKIGVDGITSNYPDRI